MPRKRKASTYVLPDYASMPPATCFRVQRERPVDWRGVTMRKGTEWAVETYEAEFPDVRAAEKRARYWAKRHRREAQIWAVRNGATAEYVARAVVDSLDRVWTEVTDTGGRYL